MQKTEMEEELVEEESSVGIAVELEDNKIIKMGIDAMTGSSLAI